MNRNTTNSFKRSLFMAFLIITFTIMCSLIVKYYVIGETQLPYALEKILIVSKVNSSNDDNTSNIWDINLQEVNDVYVYINKTDEESKETIKSVSLEKIKLTSAPKMGKVAVYRPTGDFDNLYKYSEDNYLGKSITYTGAAVDTMKKLEVRNEGGTIGFRVALRDLGRYVSNNYDEKITYDGSLLTKLGTKFEEIQFAMTFDLVIKLNNRVSYRGTVNLELPNEDILTNSDSNLEITDFSNVVFKRD